MDRHINNTLSLGRSIAYYDLCEASMLRGASCADRNVTTPPVGVCMSGAVADGGVNGEGPRYRTICRFMDHDYGSPYAQERQCVATLPQKFVSDGCYDPPSPVGSRAAAPPWKSALFAILGIIASYIAVGGAMWAMWRLANAKKRARARARAQIARRDR